MEKSQIEQFVEEFGEDYRKVITSALKWIEEKESLWKLDEPIDRREYIQCIVEKCIPRKE